MGKSLVSCFLETQCSSSSCCCCRCRWGHAADGPDGQVPAHGSDDARGGRVEVGVGAVDDEGAPGPSRRRERAGEGRRAVDVLVHSLRVVAAQKHHGVVRRQRRCGGIFFNKSSLQIYRWICWRKNIENRVNVWGSYGQALSVFVVQTRFKQLVIMYCAQIWHTRRKRRYTTLFSRGPIYKISYYNLTIILR